LVVVTPSTLFPSAFEQDVFLTVYVIWFAFIFILERVFIWSGTWEKAKARSDRGSALLIMMSVVVATAIAFVFAGVGIGPLPDWAFYVGILMMLLGIVVREWAVLTLRRYFSFQVRVLVDHKVVDTGPYRAVRHPAYAGSILTMVGLGIALRSWAAPLVILAFCGVAYGYRIAVEEKTMLKELGEDYARYMAKTKRLIPLIL
jgi:protein-S-isoprenylcysteine O-methyltransferase Ste14